MTKKPGQKPTSEATMVDAVEFFRDFRYWKQTKRQLYFLVNPFAHFKELTRVFRKTILSEKDEKKLFAVFGNPVSHSKSPLIHNYAFKKLDVEACYTRCELEEDEDIRKKILELGLDGCNITFPYKEKAFKACDVLDKLAKKTGSVNTIVKVGDKLHGYNTDATGFVKSLKKIKGAKTVLIIGAGNTAKSAAVALRDKGYSVTVLNRSKARLIHFKEKGFSTSTFEEFKGGSWDIVANLTSAGLTQETLPATLKILNEIIPGSKACIDAVYGKETPFLKLARSHGVETQDGTELLLCQGVLSFLKFTEDNDRQLFFGQVKEKMEKAIILGEGEQT